MIDTETGQRVLRQYVRDADLLRPLIRNAVVGQRPSDSITQEVVIFAREHLQNKAFVQHIGRVGLKLCRQVGIVTAITATTALIIGGINVVGSLVKALDASNTETVSFASILSDLGTPASKAWECFLETPTGRAAVAVGGTYLFHRLVVGPVCESFRAWQRARYSAFQEGHLIPTELEAHFQDLPVCSISHAPIRYPLYELVTQTNGKQTRIYYEAPALLAWISHALQHGYPVTSPCSRAVLQPGDLHFDQDLCDQVDARLRELQYQG